MANKESSQVKRYLSTADTFEKKGKKEWAYAKNGLGDEHYGKAKKAFNKANENRQKASDMMFNGKIEGKPF